MKVVFFGSSRHVVPIIEMLNNSFDLTLVITTEQGSMEPVPFYCNAKKIQYLSVRKSADLISNFEISSTMSDLGIVADFGLIIPEEVLKAFSLGVINVHPSLLPLYRGPSPVQNAILNGDKKTGVSIILLDKYVDHGPILMQEEEEIKDNDTAHSLYERLFKKGAYLLQKTISKYEGGKVASTEQKHEDATFTQQLSRDDGFIDFKNLSKSKNFLNRMIRAYYPWPGVWTKISLNSKEEDLKVVKFIPDNKIKAEGGREMDYKDFLNGYPDADKILLDFIKTEIT